MREKDIEEMKIFNKFRSDEEKYRAIRVYHTIWLRTWQKNKSDDDLREQTERLIAHIKKAMKSFGTGWGEVFYGCIPFDFVVWWGRRLDSDRNLFGLV